jgi:hypothetical protein
VGGDPRWTVDDQLVSAGDDEAAAGPRNALVGFGAHWRAGQFTGTVASCQRAAGESAEANSATIRCRQSRRTGSSRAQRRIRWQARLSDAPGSVELRYDDIERPDWGEHSRQITGPTVPVRLTLPARRCVFTSCKLAEQCRLNLPGPATAWSGPAGRQRQHILNIVNGVLLNQGAPLLLGVPEHSRHHPSMPPRRSLRRDRPAHRPAILVARS